MALHAVSPAAASSLRRAVTGRLAQRPGSAPPPPPNLYPALRSRIRACSLSDSKRDDGWNLCCYGMHDAMISKLE
jgi:hypothetical protein